MGIKTMEYVGPPLKRETLEKLERKLHAKLPHTYKKFLLKYNGGRPDPQCFKSNSVAMFLGVDLPDKTYDLASNHRVLREWLPKEVIPIADGPFGDFICLAIKGKNRGKVYFWDHEGGAPEEDPWLKFRHLIFPDEYEEATDTRRKLDWPGHPDLTLIADSFDEFLDSFHDVDEATPTSEAATRASAPEASEPAGAPKRAATPRRSPARKKRTT